MADQPHADIELHSWMRPNKAGKTMAKGEAPLDVQEARFADYIYSGLSLSEAYRRAYPESKAATASIHVLASRLKAKPAVVARLAALAAPREAAPVVRDQRLLDSTWMTLEIANGLYEIATSSASARERIEAWKALGQLRDVNAFAPSGHGGTTVNVQQNALSPGTGNDADVLRYQLISELKRALPNAQTLRPAIEGTVDGSA